jgi:hypothetical protein
MNGREKSDLAIVAEKSTNEAERPGSEPMEPRAGAEGKGIQQSAHMRFRGDDSRALCLPFPIAAPAFPLDGGGLQRR